jgi:hypothetical protein
VPGFPHYRVWDDGVVESCRRSRRIVPWYPLKPQANKDRYQAVTLRREGRSITRCVHRIALEAFVGPRPEGMQACHADGNSRNNRLENLRWDTAKANTADANRHGRIPRGSRNGRAKLSEWQIVEILRLYAAGVRVAEIAAPFDISPSTVSQIAAGRRWAHVQGVRS